jgi:hypothetical protein
MRAGLIISMIIAAIGSNAYAEDAAMQPHPMDECLEGGQFIRNAALSRDNGITREYFMSRLYADFEAIRAFPPELRWFVRNEQDETLLATAVEKVFDAPQAPRRHEIEFVDECMQSPGWRLDSVDNGTALQHAGSAMR